MFRHLLFLWHGVFKKFAIEMGCNSFKMNYIKLFMAAKKQQHVLY